MASPAHNVMHAFRRFVGLRSAWRRSLAMEPAEPAECRAELNRAELNRAELNRAELNGAEPCRRAPPCRPTSTSHGGCAAGHCRA